MKTFVVADVIIGLY